MPTHPIMSHAHFASLMEHAARATRRNRGRPGRKGDKSKRVIGAQPPDEQIGTLLFYKQTYVPDSNAPVEAFKTDTMVRDFLRQYGLKAIAPIEDTPSYRRVRIKKMSNFDLDTLKTFRIQGHEDVIVITGRLLTSEEIGAENQKRSREERRPVSLYPRKRTLRAAGQRVTEERSGVDAGTELERAAKAYATALLSAGKDLPTALREALGDTREPQDRDRRLSDKEIARAHTWFASPGVNTPKTEDQIRATAPGVIRDILVQAALKRYSNAKRAADAAGATAGAAGEAEGAAPGATPRPKPPGAKSTKTKAAPKRTPAAEQAPREKKISETEISELRDLINGVGGEPVLPIANGEPVTKAFLKEAIVSKGRVKFDEFVAMARAARAKMRADADERLREREAAAQTRTKRPPLNEFIGEEDEDEDVFAEAEAARAAAAKPPPPPPRPAAAPKAAARPAPPVTASASAFPEFSGSVVSVSGTPRFKITYVPAEGKASKAVTDYVKEVLGDLSIKDSAAQNIAAELIINRAMSGSDAMKRADALAEIYGQILAQAGATSLTAFANDELRLRAIDEMLRRMVGPAEYIPSAASMGKPTQHLKPRKQAAEEREEGEGVIIEEGEATLLRRNRRAPTIRAPRASTRFKKVREAQEKHARLADSLPALRQDLGVVRRRLTLLKGKRTAQAKYARDQLQAEATRLMRRIEKVEGQVERAAAAVARAVKAANPTVKQKVRPLKQAKPKKPRATSKRKATPRKRSR
jgi:hypothetical protein